MLGVTGQAIRARLRNDSLPGVRDGRDWRIPRAAVETLAKSVRTPTRSSSSHDRGGHRPDPGGSPGESDSRDSGDWGKRDVRDLEEFARTGVTDDEP